MPPKSRKASSQPEDIPGLLRAASDCLKVAHRNRMPLDGNNRYAYKFEDLKARSILLTRGLLERLGDSVDADVLVAVAEVSELLRGFFTLDRAAERWDIEKKILFVYRTMIEPALSGTTAAASDAAPGTKGNVIQDDVLLARLGRSLELFKEDHPRPERCGFVMMRYAETKQHQAIVEAVREICKGARLEAVRADDKRYSDDLLDNVRTYMHSCGFGIAIIERLVTNDFNPNVSLEIGYMMALSKPVCLLKDSTLPSLQTDLVGRLYETFDTQNPAGSIPPVLEKWLREKSLV